MSAASAGVTPLLGNAAARAVSRRELVDVLMGKVSAGAASAST
jgi:hypothetical protein